jgi:putative oxidoreductase
MVNAIDAKASSYHDIALVVGRILIGALFLIAAYNKSKGYDGSIAYFSRLGMPAASVMVPVTILFEVVAGLLLIVGYQTRIVALALAVFVLAAALMAHTNFGDGNNHFLKNVAIAGGCLAFFCMRAGSLFDGCAPRLIRPASASSTA